jgi:excisionase family DNA binding protein
MKAAAFDSVAKTWTQVIPQREWYSIQEVTTILHTGGPSVRNSIKRGTLTGHRVGGLVKVRHDNLVAYIARRGEVPEAGAGGLVIEEIIPDKIKSAQAIVADLAPEDLSFLDESEE